MISLFVLKKCSPSPSTAAEAATAAASAAANGSTSWSSVTAVATVVVRSVRRTTPAEGVRWKEPRTVGVAEMQLPVRRRMFFLLLVLLVIVAGLQRSTPETVHGNRSNQAHTPVRPVLARVARLMERERRQLRRAW